MTAAHPMVPDQRIRVLRPLSRPSVGEKGGDTAPRSIETDREVMPSNPFAIGVSTREGALSTRECRRVLDAASAEPFERGRMVGAAQESRECHCAWIPEMPETAWLYDRVAQVFEEANRQFRFHLTGLVEPLMAASYGPGDHFDWHLDAGPELPANRKLSLSLLLTGPEMYQGGNLEISAALQQGLRPTAGTAIVFPSFLSHRVSPVTSGRRISLVAFAYGPTFR